MAEDDKIKYSDIIQPDDSIERLIKQLEGVSVQYEQMVGAIKTGAESIARSLKSTSGATSEGRKKIDEAAQSTSRLERAEKELAFARSESGKMLAILKSQTSEANRTTVQHQKYIEQSISSYDRLKSDLKESVELYKSLSAAERADSQMGQALLQDILQLKDAISALDSQMKPYVSSLSEVEKAEQRLSYLQSEEGQRLIEIKQKIAEVTRGRKEEKVVVDSISAAREKLSYAQSDENQQLKLYSTLIQEANREAELRARINNSAEGSYNRLSAQYQLNVIALNAMSAAEREAADSGKKLEEETLLIYEQMRRLQEQTGNYRLSVGNYKKSWDGLGFSISQVVRELPAAAVSLNTFFLGISNNVPMVVDEINKLRAQNRALQAEGKPTISITKQIVKSLFGWNTALVLVLTALSMYGKYIGQWITNLFKGKDAVISLTSALKNVGKELEKTNGNYGSNIVSLRQLQEEWKNLKTVAEKNQWIKDNESEFNKLGIAINGVEDAENAFVTNTDAIIKALQARARATAAQKLAAEQYEKALIAQNKIELETEKGPNLTAARIMLGAAQPGVAISENEAQAVADSRFDSRIKKLEEERDAAEATGDAYFNLAAGYEETARAWLRSGNIMESHASSKSQKGRQPRDLTDVINRNDITIQKQYEESITKLQNDEYEKRRKAAADQVQDANNKLREMYRKNEEYVNNVEGKYRELTDEQKKQIAQQQKWITETVANNLKRLQLELQQIQKDQQANAVKTARETINLLNGISAMDAAGEGQSVVTTQGSIVRNPSEIEASLVKERELVEESLDLEYALILDQNKKLLAEGNEHARSEEEILTELNKKRLELYSKYDLLILNARKQDIEDQLALVKKGTEDELELLLQQNEIARQIALATNAAKPASEQVSTDVINAKYDKSGKQIYGNVSVQRLDEQQALDKAVFDEVERSEYETTKFKLEQEKERWEKLIALAEMGALDWSQEQIDAAKATVIGIDNQLSRLNNIIIRIGEKGLGGSLLERLGFSDTDMSALRDAVNIVIENLKEIADAEVELAERAVEAAKKRTETAQRMLELEIEGRNNGYANNVATAKKELELEKKNQREKEKILAEAQKRQEALNSISQVSSLVTATANLWSVFSAAGLAGPILASAAIAAMWTSFAAAKIKAKQLASQTEEYGEGGLEFLEGGSHASGNDIDLGVNNSRKRRMKAEGGEALAIINKKRTKQYRNMLPGIIDSLNKGTFEDKYLNAFNTSGAINVSVNSDSIDISSIEHDVRNIRKQSETKYYTRSDGAIVIQRGNVKRIIKN